MNIKQKSVKAASRESYSESRKVFNNTGTDIVANALVVLSAMQGAAYHRIVLAEAASTDELAHGAMYVTKHVIPDQRHGIVAPWAILTGVNTNGSTVGNPVYLSDVAGGWSLTASTTWPVKIGQVEVVHLTAGVVYLEPRYWAGVASSSGVGLKIADDKDLTFGTDSDAFIRYDEAGGNDVRVTGADWSFESVAISITGATGALLVGDDLNFSLGSNGDWTISYDEAGGDDLEFAGVTVGSAFGLTTAAGVGGGGVATSGAISFTSGDGAAAGASGALIFLSGEGVGAASDSGSLSLTSGDAADGDSGFLSLTSGNVVALAAANISGRIVLATGSTVASTNAAGPSGLISFTTGNTTATGAFATGASGEIAGTTGDTDTFAGGTAANSGAVNFTTGECLDTGALGASGVSGLIGLTTGATVSANSGAIGLVTGDAVTAGDSGAISLTTGLAAGGTRGDIALDANSATLAMGAATKRIGGMVAQATAPATRAGDVAGPANFTNAAFTFPADTLRIGDVIRVKYGGNIQSSADAGTETIQIRLLFDGDVLMDATATAMTDNDEFFGEYELTIRTLAAGGTAWGMGKFVAPAAAGAGTPVYATGASTPDNVGAAPVLSVSATWAGAGITAADEAILEYFTVEVL